MEGLGLGLDNMLDDGADLFTDIDDNTSTEETQEETVEETEETEEKNDTTEIDPEELFGESESVGSEEDNKDNKEDTSEQQDDGTSPKNFFSSLSTACRDEGVFPDLEDDEINSVKDAQGFRDLLDKQIKAGLTEQQRRVAEALDNGVEEDKIKANESLLSWLDSQDKSIEEEGDVQDNLRRKIIMQDYLNRGFSEERAKKAVEKAFNDGSEMEEAKDALSSLKSFYKKNYEDLLENAKQEAKKEAEENDKRAAKIKKTVLEEDIKLFNGIPLDKEVRQKAFDAISKPVYKDPKTGEFYTAIQKLELDDREGFMAKLGLLYELTDGFKTVDKLVKQKAKKEIKRGFSDLEKKLNNTSRTSDGDIHFSSGVNDDNAFLRKGVKLDL